MENKLQFAKHLKTTGKNLLETKGIVNDLCEFGNVTFTGSYSLDLMVWPDIDIQVDVNNKHDRIKVFTDLAYKYLQDTDFKNVKLINFTPGKKPGMPTGMYMGLICNNLEQKWKIDIWALDQEHIENNIIYMDKVRAALTQDLKEFIIEYKHKLLKDGRVPQLGSYMLYKAVLFEKITNENDIMDFLIKNGVKI